MLEEIQEAQNQSYLLGLKLNLPLPVVDYIYETYSQPRDRLLQVLIEFTHQVEPRPTWKAIAAALKSPTVDLPRLAKIVEAAHCGKMSAGTQFPTACSLKLFFHAQPLPLGLRQPLLTLLRLHMVYIA